MTQQLLREFPPGFGGVERVAHCLAAELGGTVFSLNFHENSQEPLIVKYRRRWVISIAFGRLFIPLPSAPIVELLLSSSPLIAHLPCPTVLCLALIARIFRPYRSIHFYWHSYLAPRKGIQGFLEFVYQWFALRFLKFFCNKSICLAALECNLIKNLNLYFFAKLSKSFKFSINS